MTSPLPWLRLWDSVLDDPKVQKLPDRLFRHWVNLLCLANRGSERGRLPANAEDIAFALRISEEEAADALAELTKRELVAWTPEGEPMPHNWNGRQFASDDSKERVKAYRERLSKVGGTSYIGHREEVMGRDGGACVYCGSTANVVIDHLIPVARGGDNQPDNLVAACKRCNSGKAGRLLEETTMTFRDPARWNQYQSAKDRLSPLVTVTSKGDSSDSSRNTVTVQEQSRTEQSRANGSPPTPLRGSRFAAAVGAERFKEIATNFTEANPQLTAGWLDKTMAQIEADMAIEQLEAVLLQAALMTVDAFSTPNRIQNPRAWADKRLAEAAAEARSHTA